VEAAAGVDTTVVVHFDQHLRETTYDAFVAMIAGRAPLAGFLMTPDAAFGYRRGGTPETLAARILEVEHRLYPRAVRLLLEGRCRVEGRRVIVEGE